jgi:protocatechuate 3,4-dioxygenase alpha subunit
MSELTPSQTVGPFFHISLTTDAALLTDLVGPDTPGERIVIEGTVKDGEGAPLPDAMVEIWQADAAGHYNPPPEGHDKPVDGGFGGFGRAATDPDGRFRFSTIKPGPVPGRGNTLQAPHISVALFARGLLKELRTRLYFADEAANDSDPVLALVPQERRGTITAKRLDRPEGAVYRFDIVLQGDGETVFFDV